MALTEVAKSHETLTLTLGDIVDAPELFEAYLQLRKVTVDLEPYSGRGSGQYLCGVMAVSATAFVSESVLAHEVQHATTSVRYTVNAYTVFTARWAAAGGSGTVVSLLDLTML
ncbi:MAG: hypothetical protein MdMp014T_0211 [Treponematales bacterium]